MATVQLLSHTGEPEKIIAAAAKLCYSPVGVDSLLEGLDDEKSAKFVGMLADLGHESPIEHVAFTFAIEDVSRALLAQITRHRIASFSVQSQRYVRENKFEYIMPPAVAECPAAREVFLKAMEDAQRAYGEIAALLQEKHQGALAAGAPAKDAVKAAEKSAIEDARFVLPNACETKMVVTMNARSLQNFFRLRCCNRAQWEIRDVAQQMLELVLGVAPTLFQKAGPACVRGACSEGRMGCGKMQEVRLLYKKLCKEAAGRGD